jgi:hypothetical protein
LCGLTREVLFGRFVVCPGALVSLLEVCLVSFASSIVVVVVVACEIEASTSRVRRIGDWS